MLRPDQPHNQTRQRDSIASPNGRYWSPGVPLGGIVVPLITPLAGRDRIDDEGLGRLIERVVEGDVDAVFLLGTTGEAASLSPELRRQFVETAVRLIAKRVPTLVGVTDNSLVTTIQQAEHAATVGADAVVVTTPFYLTPDRDELGTYVRTIAQETPLPLFLYNMPRLTKAWFDTQTVSQLMEIEQIVGIKDSSGDLPYFQALCDLGKRRPDWSLLVGTENLIPEALRLGGHGCVGGGGNVWPGLLSAIYAAQVRGDAKQVDSLQAELAKVHQMFADGPYALGSIRAIKTALNLLGVCSEQLAAPFSTSTPAEREQTRRIMEENGLFKSPATQASLPAAVGQRTA